MSHYILKDGAPIEEPDFLTWVKWAENYDNRLIAFTEVGDARISTMFLGLDHSFGGGAHVLYETMVFGGELDRHRKQYCTLEEAMIGHKHIVGVVRANTARRLTSGMVPLKRLLSKALSLLRFGGLSHFTPRR